MSNSSVEKGKEMKEETRVWGLRSAGKFFWNWRVQHTRARGSASGTRVCRTRHFFSTWTRFFSFRFGLFLAFFSLFLSVFVPKKLPKTKKHMEYSTYCPKYISNVIICMRKIGSKVEKKKQFFAFSQNFEFHKTWPKSEYIWIGINILSYNVTNKA